MFCNVPIDNVFDDPALETIYELPIALEKQKADMKFLEIMAEIKMERQRHHLDMVRQDDESARAVTQDVMRAMELTQSMRANEVE